ncbi:association domain-containing 2-like isoform X1 [Octopus vulgaris]|uniref:Association domain-containing 2-like isoform X1 n=1 Tax=Octopus vulgaris TaxID=6645 RepID=A0AA36F6J3_OCTVU|nr:association domain-containing 2-like isoform X1 [Octopus vulgaris]
MLSLLNCLGRRSKYPKSERKTSLGKEWHPRCLRCDQCDKVLAPGQHAEHKGLPYCNQCYQALYGPQMCGYGSNVFSQANYRKKLTIPIRKHGTKDPPTLRKSGNVVAVSLSEDEEDEDDLYDSETLKPGMSQQYCFSTASASMTLPVKHSSQTSLNNGCDTNLLKNEHSLLPMNNGGPPSSLSRTTIPSPNNHSETSSTLNHSPIGHRTLTSPDTHNAISSSKKNNSLSFPIRKSYSFSPNGHRSIYSNPAFQTLPVPADFGYHSSQDAFGTLTSSVSVGTLTSPISYANLSKIFENSPTHSLKQTDDTCRQDILEKFQLYNAFYEGKRGCLSMDQVNGVDVLEGPLRIYWQVTIPIQLKHCDDVPVPPIASWRHSYYATPTGNGLNVDAEEPQAEQSPQPTLPKYGMDDSVIIPNLDGVVRRRNIRKSNTVAYRADRPSKWKRASINGHIYNYDTRVFTPVIGSCTSVTVNSTMTVPLVIKTLLEKFKVENDADEFSLYVVTEAEGEREIGIGEIPLEVRLRLGADETNAKIFIREKDYVGSVVVPEEVEPIEEKTCYLPTEVEQLIALPEAVLKGLLQKFFDDEEKDVEKIKDKYIKARTVIKNYLADIKPVSEL